MIFFMVAFSLFFNSNDVYATHAMGADLTYSCIGNNQYRIRLQFYRDCNGINATNSVSVNVNSPGCQNLNVTLTRVSLTEVTPVCPGIVGTACNGGGGQFGIERFVYEGVVTLPSSCSNWVFSWRLCCRNAAISTLSNPTGDQMFLSAQLNTSATSCNNSPNFLNNPTPFVCRNQPVFYNHGATDADGDQLRYSLTPCQDSLNNPVSYNTAAGFNALNPMTTLNGVNIDPNTGALSFTPTAVQVGVICVLVEEFRAGVKIGQVLRDIQFTVVNCVNQMPTLTGMNGTNSFIDTAVIGQQFCFTVNSNDTDLGQTLTINYNNGLSGGTFSQAGTPYPVGTFCWTPTLADTGLNSLTLQVTDDYCPIVGQNTYTYSIFVAPPPPPVVLCTVTVALGNVENLLCANNDGSAVVIVNGGAQPYTISVINWTTGEVFTNSTGIFTNLTAGSYSVFVTDNAGCQPDCTNLNFTISGSVNPLSIRINSSDILCASNPNDGSIRITVTGGTAPYMYNIGNGFVSSGIFSNLPAGIYPIIVMDANGCSASGTATISQPTLLTNNIASVIQPSCGANNGSFIILPSGGVSPYTYTVNGLNSSDVVTNLGNGIYNVEVTDANGCTSVSTVTLQGTPALNLNLISSNVSCNGGCNGSVVASTTGSRLSYVWSNTEVSSSINNLCPGVYTVTATDANGCANTASATITEPNGLQIIANNIIQPSCGNSNGGFSFTVSGGTTPYNYTINGLGVNQNIINGLPNGVYTIGVVDANGCQTSTQVTLNGTSNFTITSNSTNVTCNAACDGTATVISSSTNTNYLWSNGASASSISNLCAGTYSVSVTDQTGCQVTSSVLVTEPAAIVLSLASSTNETCAGNDGTATVAVSGGTAPFIYNLANISNGTVTPSTSGIFGGLNAGFYAFNVTDANGCEEQCLGTFQILDGCDNGGNLNSNSGSQNQSTTSYLLVTTNELTNVAQLRYNASNEKTVNFNVIDTNGNIIKSLNNVKANGSVELNVNSFKPATYFVVMSDLNAKVIKTARLTVK